MSDLFRALTERLNQSYQQGFADGQLYAQGEIARLRRIVDLLLPALADMTEEELNDLEVGLETEEQFNARLLREE